MEIFYKINGNDARILFYSLSFLAAGILVGAERVSREYSREFDSWRNEIRAYKETLELQAHMIASQERKRLSLEWKIEELEKKQSKDKPNNTVKRY